METDWSHFEYHPADDEGLTFKVSDLSVYIPRAACDGISAAKWENGLSLAVEFQLGTACLRIQASRWQHGDDAGL
jgi:hypothetical protein